MDSDIEENVMELIAKPEVKYEEPPMYKSKFRKSVRQASVRGKSAYKTLGLPNVSLNPPTQFLRKRSRIEVKRTDIKHNHYHIPNYQHKLPAWEPQQHSNHASNLLENLKISRKDFKKENIMKIKNSQAKNAKLYFIDDRYGNSFPQKPNSFSVPENSKNKDLLSYNLKINQRQKKKTVVEKHYDLKESASQKDTKEPVNYDSSKSNVKQFSRRTELKKENMCRYVTQEERTELLNGMKKRWEELMKQFQGLPFLTDTPAKVKRKAKMEQDLKQLEKDIDMIERHPHIYVYNDENNH